MAVPAHDQRDYEFATKFGLPIVPVVRSADDSEPPKDKAYVDYGVLFESGEFSGMPSEQARLAIAAEAQRRVIGKPAVNYHLRDWGVSRQRYWGTPIPIIYCPKDDPEGKGIPVPDSQLPVALPDIDVKEVLTGKGTKITCFLWIEMPAVLLQLKIQILVPFPIFLSAGGVGFCLLGLAQGRGVILVAVVRGHAQGNAQQHKANQGDNQPLLGIPIRRFLGHETTSTGERTGTSERIHLNFGAGRKASPSRLETRQKVYQ